MVQSQLSEPELGFKVQEHRPHNRMEPDYNSTTWQPFSAKSTGPTTAEAQLLLDCNDVSGGGKFVPGDLSDK